MSSPLRINPDALPHPAKFGRDAASAWLDRVTAMLRVPASERDAIRAELNEHLRERIRDLMLAGASEHAATSQAISELGDAASLARRYQEAIEPSSRRSLMHVGLATAATAALVFSGAALVQNGGPSNPTPATAPVAVAAPTLTPNEEVLARQLDDLRRAVSEQREVIAQQERELARARGEAESLQYRVRSAEERAAAMQQEAFVVQRQFMSEQEGARRAHSELDKVVRERDAALAQLKAIEEARSDSAKASPPAKFEPERNPARELIDSLAVDTENATTLGEIMVQDKIREKKIYLRNANLADIQLDGNGKITLPNRPLSLGEVLDVINSNNGESLMALSPQLTPDGRVAIDTQESWDRSDRSLVIYDLADIVARTNVRNRASAPSPMYVPAVDQLRMVITRTVTPDLWEDNGGDLGAIQVLTTSLVVTAPERSHHQIRWIVEQMRDAAKRAEVPILSDLPLVNITTTRPPILTDVPLLDASRIAADHEIQPARKHDFPAPVETKDAK